jgi:hypothetical protein
MGLKLSRLVKPGNIVGIDGNRLSKDTGAMDVDPSPDGIPVKPPRENMPIGLIPVESIGKLVSKPNWNGIDSALAEVESINTASMIKAILTSFILALPR